MVWLHSNKTLFTKTTSWIWPSGCSFLTLVLVEKKGTVKISTCHGTVRKSLVEDTLERRTEVRCIQSVHNIDYANYSNCNGKTLQSLMQWVTCFDFVFKGEQIEVQKGQDRRPLRKLLLWSTEEDMAHWRHGFDNSEKWLDLRSTLMQTKGLAWWK